MEEQLDLLKTLKAKTVSAEEAAAWVKSGERLDYGFGPCQPDAFDRALAARRDQLEGVVIRNCLSTAPRQVIEVDPEQQHFHVENWHFSTYDRRQFDRGLVSYVPFNFGEGPRLYREFLEVDLVILKTAPMDAHGYFNFGPCTTYHRAICDTARRIIVETCAHVPIAHGVENVVHIDEVDGVIEGDDRPLPELPPAPITDIDRTVASYIVNEVEDGSCLQIGIGGMPNAVCSALAQSSARDLGIHTEMFVDGMIDLIEAGKVTGRHKQTYRGKVIYSFALGTQRCYDFLDGNEMCLALPVNLTNLPANITANPKVVSINNAIQIDLTGQVCSESAGHAQRTGTGGQLQFVRGAFESAGGKSFICLSSRYARDGSKTSRIVTALPEGAIVTTPRTDVMYVVTEYGIINLKGMSVSERALAMISLAHPDDRKRLTGEAIGAGLLPRRYRQDI
jgi:acyl-CoA hydrolase